MTAWNRALSPADLPVVKALLDHQIATGVAHFGTEPTDLAALEAELAGRDPRHPWLAREQDGRVVGFAKAGPWKSRGAYRWSAEVSVYIEPGHHRAGHGRALVSEVIDGLRAAGLHTAIAGMTLPNPGSEGLFKSLGLEPVGVFKEVGFKHGAWRDVGYLALRLQPEGHVPG